MAERRSDVPEAAGSSPASPTVGTGPRKGHPNGGAAIDPYPLLKAADDAAAAVREAYREIGQYERALLSRLLSGLNQMPELKVWGISDPERIEERVAQWLVGLPAQR